MMFESITTVIRRMSLVEWEQEHLTLPEDLSSHLMFTGVRVLQSLSSCVFFCGSLLVRFSLGHCIVCLRFTTSDVQQYFNMALSFIAEEAGIPGENHQPAVSHCQTISHNCVYSTPRNERYCESITLEVIDTDCIGSHKSNYYTSMTTTATVNSVRLVVSC